MRVALCQIDSVWENRAATRDRIVEVLTRLPATHVPSTQSPSPSAAQVGAPGVDCLIFPEMTLTGFSMQPRFTTLTAEDHGFFELLARRYSAAVVYGGVEDLYNTFFLVEPAAVSPASSAAASVSSVSPASSAAGYHGTRPLYRKRHLFAFGGETAVYRPGDAPARCFTLGPALAVPAICYDLRFAYHFWPHVTPPDAAATPVQPQPQVFVVIANWPAGRREHWIALLRARAIENLAYVVGVNRAGRDPHHAYAGDSLVCAPDGSVVADAGSAEGIIIADIDIEFVNHIRADYRFLQDRQE